MSDDSNENDSLVNINEKLKKEIENLKNQAVQTSEGVKGLLAQIEAYKQYINENIAMNLNLRTNIVLLQQKNQELSNKFSI